MPQIIEVPDVGEVEFPDSMSDADIVAAIKTLRARARSSQSDVRAAENRIDRGAAAPQNKQGQFVIGREGMKDAARQVGAEQNVVGRFATGIANAVTRIPSAIAELVGVQSESDRDRREVLREATEGSGIAGTAGDVLGSIAVMAPVPVAGVGRTVSSLGGRGVAQAAGKAAPVGSKVLDAAATNAGINYITTEGDATERGLSAAFGAVLSGGVPLSVAAMQGIRNTVTKPGGRRALGARLAHEVGPERAEELIQRLEGSYPSAAAGTKPTSAMLTNEPVLQNMELGARTKRPDLFASIDDANSTARAEAVQRIAKSPAELAEAEAARDAATGPMRQAALDAARTVQGFEAPVAAAVGDLLTGASRSNPSVKAMANYVRRELDEGVTPEQLYTIRKSLTGGLPFGSELGAAVKQARAERIALVKAIDDALDQASGGQWSGYLGQYRAASEPIDSMRAGQGILDSFSTARETSTGAPVLSRDKLARAVEKHGSKQFGSKTVSRLTTEERATLDAVIDDLQRQSDVMKSRAVTGSDTATKLTAGERFSDIATTVVAPKLQVARELVKFLRTKYKEDRLAEILQNPDQLALALRGAMAQGAFRDALMRGAGHSSRGFSSD